VLVIYLLVGDRLLAVARRRTSARSSGLESQLRGIDFSDVKR
jgi:hypothetical protein